MRFCVVTLGCKVNQYETQAMAEVLISRGHVMVKQSDAFDICIVNTCAVTQESARKSRQAIRHAKRTSPDALVAVCGCLSQIEPSTIEELGADLIGGSHDRLEFALEVEKRKALSSTAPRRGVACNTHPHTGGTLPSNGDKPPPNFEALPPGAMENRTRGLLKIQDGCDNRCAYCVIPQARGPARSLPLAQVAEYAIQLAERGYREIVITGIEISSYGSDLPGNPTLADAIHAIAKAAPAIRLRLGSLDPSITTESFCAELQAIPNLCEHFHLSLQSGCDDTLLRMGRRYDTRAANEAIKELRRRFKNCGISADLITGFPGETEEEFAQTMTFIRAAAFSRMHIFPYSPRKGTRAADMPNQVDKATRQERARIASSAAREMSRAFAQSQIGKTAEVLFERQQNGISFGYSRNYIEIAVKNGAERNSIRNVQITAADDDYVWGKMYHYMGGSL